MPKKQLTDAEKHTFNVAMGFRAANGKLKPDSIGHGKGLSTNREENVVKHLVDPEKPDKRPSLLGCIPLIMVAKKGGRRFLPFDMKMFLKLIRLAQDHGHAGDGSVQAVWDHKKLAEITGGAAPNWTTWVSLALNVGGREDHRFRPIIKMSELDRLTRTALEANGTIEPGRSRPFVGLTTTAMCSYLMAQTQWPEETYRLVSELQACVNAQADHLEPLMPKPEDEEIVPVADPAVEGALNELELGTTMTVTAAVEDEEARLTREAAEATARLVAFQQGKALRDRKANWPQTTAGIQILSATPNEDWTTPTGLVTQLPDGRIATWPNPRITETTTLTTLQFNPMTTAGAEEPATQH